jgi:hypothetical protein
MDDSLPQRFFLEPSCAQQRQYEALRAVFVEQLPQQEVARRFHYSYGAFRLLIHQFRTACAAGQPPPFLSGLAEVGLRRRQSPRRRPARTSPRSPMPAP